jgi:hypothetical protein
VEDEGREQLCVCLGKRLSWDNRSKRQQEDKGGWSKLLQKQRRKTRNMGALKGHSSCCVKGRDLHGGLPCSVSLVPRKIFSVLEPVKKD